MSMKFYCFSDCMMYMYNGTGGYFAGSLAIMTDAAHMLSDFAGFLISLFAIWLASRPSSNRMSFGWHRAGKVSLKVHP